MKTKLCIASLLLLALSFGSALAQRVGLSLMGTTTFPGQVASSEVVGLTQDLRGIGPKVGLSGLFETDLSPSLRLRAEVGYYTLGYYFGQSVASSGWQQEYRFGNVQTALVLDATVWRLSHHAYMGAHAGLGYNWVRANMVRSASGGAATGFVTQPDRFNPPANTGPVGVSVRRSGPAVFNQAQNLTAIVGASYNYQWDSGLRFSLSATYQQALGTSPRTDVDLQVSYTTTTTTAFNLVQTLNPNLHFLNVGATVSYPLRKAKP